MYKLLVILSFVFLGVGPFTIPFDESAEITSGMYYDLNFNSGNFHGGIDYSLDSGVWIYAAESGTVVHKEDCWPNTYGITGDVRNPCTGVWKSSYQYGNFIEIDHGNGLRTIYAHILTGSFPSGIEVGTSVARGEKIAEVGNTGYSTSAHLHFEILRSGVKVDPYDINGYSGQYPETFGDGNVCGPNHLWTVCPPIPSTAIEFVSQGSSSSYLPMFQSGYERFKSILGQPVSNEVFELSWYPGILVKEYRNGGSALSFRNHSGYALLVLDVADGNDFWPVR